MYKCQPQKTVNISPQYYMVAILVKMKKVVNLTLAAKADNHIWSVHMCLVSVVSAALLL